MSNCTAVTEFLLLGFSNALELQILHLATFLIIYLAALIGNLLVIMLIAFDSHLHTPMYFFLLNLSILDIGSISVIVPKSMANSILNTRLISYSRCITQAFFFLFFLTADLAILTIMAYDRYIAICKPLHYATVMNRRACLQMAAMAWSTTVLYSALHTGNTFRLPFCHSNIINQFFCEVPQLLRISGSEVFTSEIQIIIFGTCLCVGCILFIFVSYIKIFTTVLRIPSEQGWQKAVSTCLPHLIVVSLLGSTGLIAYVKPTSGSPSALDLMVSVLYSMIPPMMNPVIYSMRNKDIKAALWKLIRWKWFIPKKMSVILQ
ncbi:olfactory receptor 14A16-like [Alligator mississippiensis]|uniref:olfactory receptor 14A16-like n=1 Tax=Alligator mississippiensis TaxID=8496 RepID=UPI0003D0B1EB|nr:olfactory receptor 14A16-like [Alligator mississippiensis]